MKRLAIFAFLFGLVYSEVVVAYYLALKPETAARAAFIDLALGFLAIGSLQAWELSGRRFNVLVAEVVGMSLGTYLATIQG